MKKTLKQLTLSELDYDSLLMDLYSGDFSEGWEFYPGEDEGSLGQWACNSNATFWAKKLTDGWRVVAREGDYNFLELYRFEN